jgi:nickel-dependent lactate racemase
VTSLELRSAAWYGDQVINLPHPAAWRVTVHDPKLGEPWNDDAIIASLENPIEQRPIREMATGARRPVVLLDDLNRPTPAGRVVPALLEQFNDAGIPAANVTVVMAPGTHGRPPPDAFVRKLGAEIAGRCRVRIHDCRGPLITLGRTPYGTPVLINPEVAASDFLVGLGGLYPNSTGGYGGGSKMILGVLGLRSIAALHFGHSSMGWGTPNQMSSFRRDLDLIAQMARLRSSISVQVNAAREVIDVVCGDPTVYYPDAMGAARSAFRAPSPVAADVVIANAYPNDLSLTFARMKGMAPFRRAASGTSRVLIAACPEGLGFHGLFPFMNAPPGHRNQMRLVQVRTLAANPRRLIKVAQRRLGSRARAESPAVTRPGPILMYRPETTAAAPLPAAIPGMRVVTDWDEVVETVAGEQGGDDLAVEVYPCAPLQWIE